MAKLAATRSKTKNGEVDRLLRSVKESEGRLKELKHSFDEKAAQAVNELIRKNNIQIVDFKFNDLPGENAGGGVAIL